MKDHRIDILFPSSQQTDNAEDDFETVSTDNAEDEVETVSQRVSRILERLPAQMSKAYVPQVVSLGPFYFGKPQLAKYESFKSKIPDIIVDRAGRPPFTKLVEDMIDQCSKIRQWYKFFHNCPYSDEELGWIMARDGLFLLRFLRKIFTRDWDCDQATRYFFLQNQLPSAENQLVSEENELPLAVEEDVMKLENQTAMFAAVQTDIMKLENQIPMFSLQMILQWQAGTDLDLKSILRHVWHTLSPFLYKRERLDSHVLAGTSFRPHSHLLGIVYEKIICSSDSSDHTEHNRMWKKKRYMTLPSAVELYIIHNRLGTDEEVANAWTGMREVMGKGEYEPIDTSIDDVITFYTNYEYIMICADLKEKYFPRAWLVVSTLAGCIVLFLSVLQTLLAWEQVRLQRQSM